MWISRSCRPGIAFGVSALQTACNKPFVSDILKANTLVQHVLDSPDVGMVYRPGLQWPKPAAPNGDPRTSSRDTRDASTSSEHTPVTSPYICIIACSDASHGGEDEWLDDWQEREPFRSQGAKLIFISSRSIIDTDQAQVHLVSFASTIQSAERRKYTTGFGTGDWDRVAKTAGQCNTDSPSRYQCLFVSAWVAEKT